MAAQAGLQMLVQGGNAVDAALATAIALTVVEPTMNGIGGDLFAIVHDGKGLQGINATGRAPQALDLDRYNGRNKMPEVGWDTVTVPGQVAGWADLHSRFGKLPFETLFEAAIRYAEEGFLVTPAIAEIWALQVDLLKSQPGFAENFLPKGRAPRTGEHFLCRDQAETLRQIAETKGASFYTGTIADKIVAQARAEGSSLNADDLGGHKSLWVEPMGVSFRGHTLHELPPNGQGIAALIALGIMERLDLDAHHHDSSARQHLEIEATKIGLHDLATNIADPERMEIAPHDLLDPARLDELAKSIDPNKVAAPNPGKRSNHGTVYLAAADDSGMMISLIQSNYKGFGSGVVIRGTGIAMHNRGLGFVTTPGHPNQVAGGKRPLSSIIPGFATKDGKATTAFGVMGGSMQPQGHVQIASRMFAGEQNPQAASDAPRWRFDDGRVRVEEAWSDAFVQGLEQRGHALHEGTDLDFGAAQIIHCHNGAYVAASESRRDGYPVGF
ncbi:MAG: gamma-glutamyltransferase family protein [Hyphomicrobiaceae bacterium]